jgi:thiamine-phosphate pyrophosphorylase
MRYVFTPGAERALNCAYGWSSRNGCDELEPEALLLGLLGEECRAATILAKLAIDVPAVRQQWPKLVDDPSQPTRGERPFSPEIELSLRSACDRLTSFPRPFEMATEHILLGLAVANHEVAAWLRERGLDPNVLEADILELHGHESGPVEYEEEEIVAASAEPWDFPLEQELVSSADNSDATAGPTSEFASAAPTSELPTNAPAAGSISKFGLAARPRRINSGASEEIAVLRVLDAAANRAREGLRVVEDYVRFVLDDRHLTGLCKQLRHDLTDVLSRISPEERFAARETQADVGTELSTAAEENRGETAAVLAANVGRLQESLRSLEEFGKVFDAAHGNWSGSCIATAEADVQLSPQPAGLAAVFKQLRYGAYTLQRSIEITRSSIERLAAARLYVLIDGRQSADEFQRLAGSLIAAGVDVLQLRDKRLGDRELLDRARLLSIMTQGTKTLFVMNDRPDVAALAQADGVHLGQEEISVKDARSIIGPHALVGVSTHSVEQARRAVLDGANYIGVGPTFASPTKQFSQYPGVELLRAVAAEIRLPAFAIGGISRDNLDEVLAAGFTRIAVSSAIIEAADPAQAARELSVALNHGRRRDDLDTTEHEAKTWTVDHSEDAAR